MTEYSPIIASWTPPDWVCWNFPMPTPNTEVASMEYIVAALQSEVDACKEWETTSLGRVLHVAHLLVTLQGKDGLWSGTINLRTGEDVDDTRSNAPLPLFRRLNALLDSSEFDFSLRRAEAGDLSHKE